MDERTRDDGYALVEVLAGLAASLIVVTAAVSLLAAHNRLLKRQADLDLAQQILDGAIEVVEERLLLADHLWIAVTEDASPEDGHVIKCGREGYLWMDGEMIFPKAYYQGYRLACRTRLGTGEPDLLALSWTLLGPDGERCASGETRMEIPNLSLFGGAVGYGAEDADSREGGLYFYFGYLEDGDLEGGNPRDGNQEDGNPGDGNQEDGNPGDGNQEDGNPGDGNQEDGNPGDGNEEDRNFGDGNQESVYQKYKHQENGYQENSIRKEAHRE